MVLPYEQAKELLASIQSVRPDSLDCDGCLALVPELADAQLGRIGLSEVLQSVENHLTQCECCAYEYQALLDALRAADELSKQDIPIEP